MMLSRIAESMFWIGRYVERAEDTARLLQTHLRLLVEDSSTEVQASANLLALMSVEGVEDPDHTDLLRLLAYDRREPSSIFSCWAAARDNARRAREVIPLDLWECINATWHQLPSGGFGVARANGFLNWARERSALFGGIARGTMVRDDGWQFLSLGRCLEQADMTSRLVASASVSGGASQWPSVLRGCGGHDAFLRTYRGVHNDASAAEFLIRDARFPRSIMHGLDAASDCLAKLAVSDSAGSGRDLQARRQLGQLRSRLEYADMNDLVAHLDEEMGAVQDVTAAVTELVTRQYFAAEDQQAWVTEGTR
ncbi:MAG: alpha-E domain-containing protein [Janthinobacterium lividum]